MKKQKLSLSFIDLFCGAGGLSRGLEMAGHKCLLGVDFDKHAINTFAHNHKNAEAYCGDICDLKDTKLKNILKNQRVDMVVGGPPCQGFSTVGLGNPNDTRNKLFREFCRLVKTLEPSYVVIENVTGIL
ncbi:MAG: DNA cytosine methyltransferase, partial [bacterium]